jgi:dihydroorotate dehydrogenase
MFARLRPLLFRADPERAHATTLRLLQLVAALTPLAAITRRFYAIPSNDPIELFGIRFPNRLGLAAGYDKDGLAWRGLACLGFGHVEIGTVTPRPQTGNPKPRLFRLVEDDALINRMGFPGRGAEFVARRLQGSRPKNLVIGVNLGVNKDSPIEHAAEDYQALVKRFNPLADYLVINVSSPNTPGLRTLQGAKALDDLLKQIVPLKQKPLLVKLAPDLNEQQLGDALKTITDHAVDGIIATNTTLGRPALRSQYVAEAGGLSGAPLTALSRKTIGQIYTQTLGKLPIIAAGGIMSRQDAEAAINAGASLVQIFTGLVFRGPGLIREILEPE